MAPWKSTINKKEKLEKREKKKKRRNIENRRLQVKQGI